jgi:hypothetical protein
VIQVSLDVSNLNSSQIYGENTWRSTRQKMQLLKDLTHTKEFAEMKKNQNPNQEDEEQKNRQIIQTRTHK